MENAFGFVHLETFEADWKRLRLDDDDLRVLELAIAMNPQSGKVVKGTGGLRKLRFAPPRGSKGKRGAIRVGYVFFPRYGLVALVVAYAKNERADIDAVERKEIKRLIDEIQRMLAERKMR